MTAEVRAMAGLTIFPRSNEACHCRIITGAGARSKVWVPKTVMEMMLPRNGEGCSRGLIEGVLRTCNEGGSGYA